MFGFIRGIKDAISNIPKVIVDNFNDFKEFLGLAWNDFVKDFKKMIDFVANIPKVIIDSFNSLVEVLKLAFNDLMNSFKWTIDFLTSLPKTIFDGIVRLIVPDWEVIKSSFAGLKDSITKKFNVYFPDLTTILTGSEEPNWSTENLEINLMGYNYSFEFNYKKYLYEGILFFRYLIRGVVVLWILMFHINQYIMLTGGQPITVSDVKPIGFRKNND